MSSTSPKPPPEPSQIDWDVTEFIRNPGGTIHDVRKEDAVLAIRGHGGYRLATLEEAKAYCVANNIDPAGLKDYAKHVKEVQRAVEVADAAAAGNPAPAVVEEDEPSQPSSSKK